MVAGGVAVFVVDGLEVVEVDDRHRQLLVVAPGQGQQAGQGEVEVPAVEQAGECVAHGEFAQLPLQRLNLVDLARELLVGVLQRGPGLLDGAASGFVLFELVFQPQQLGLQGRGLVACPRGLVAARGL